MSSARYCSNRWSRAMLQVSLLASSMMTLVNSVAIGQQSDFERDILPVLTARCITCHAGDQAESGLDLSNMLAALRGGDSGEPTIVPGDSQASYLIARITSDDDALQMPPDERLPEAEVQLLRNWIDEASGWEALQQLLATQEDQHWSFRPVLRPVPSTPQLHPIDSFVQDRLGSVGLERSPVADRRRLIRRLYLVMHGLLPTPEAVDQFANDNSSDAWEQLIERVLGSPRYGEQMAAYWLDIVRYGETNGFETNRERPHAYHYRDWVVDSFNADLPYDQFIMAQLAGDALGQPAATGFLVAGPNDIVKGQDALLGLMQRQDELTDMVNVTGTTFLGLTAGCARCHNHKFDPISQVDFYAMQAVFAGVEHGDRTLPHAAASETLLNELQGELVHLRSALEPWVVVPELRPPVNARENVEPIEPTAARYLRMTVEQTSGGEPCVDELQVFAGDRNVALAGAGTVASSSGDFEHPLHKLPHIHDGQFGNARSWIASQVQGGWVQLEFPETVDVERIVWGRDRNGEFADRLATSYSIGLSLDGEEWTEVASSRDRQPLGETPPALRYAVQQAAPHDRAALELQILRAEALQQRLNELQQPRLAYVGNFVSPPAIQRLYRGDPLAPREVVGPDTIQRFGQLNLAENASELQRRLALAQWIVQPGNPLTARVMANRLWQFHFGTGLVDTPNDLGRNGTSPSHPDLLDWLACELESCDWSIKQLHRTILRSQTWCQDSQPNAAGLARDADARLLWRYPPRRLPAEAIRDNILAASGALDLSMGGPGFSPFDVSMENVRHYFPKQSYGPEDWRRMLYMLRVRQEREPTFGAFDCPDPSQPVPLRNRSTTPLQALNLLNSPFVIEQSDRLAQRLRAQFATDDQRIRAAYRLCFGRQADSLELQEGIEFAGEQGLEAFCRAIFNANEFLFIP